MSVAAYARRYCEIGLALTPLRAGRKEPKWPQWAAIENTLRAPDKAYRYFAQNPDEGMGAVLGHSGLVSLDADDVERTGLVLRGLGIDLAAWRASAPAIIGNPARFRLEYEAPAGVVLRRRVAYWPKQDDSTKRSVIFELRAGAFQDVLPPSRHPGTGGRYKWDPPPVNGFPPLPAELLALWLDWNTTEARIFAQCPWYVPPRPRPQGPSRPRAEGSVSVIDEFNRVHSVAKLLEAHGYKYKHRERRFASPDTEHAAGIVLLEDGRAVCYHVGDPLDRDGRAVDAFAIYAQLEHGGDVRAAVKAAAEKLGLPNSRAAA